MFNAGDLRILSLVETTIEEKDDPEFFTKVDKLSTSDFAFIARIDGNENFRIRALKEQRTDEDDASFLTKLDNYKRVVIPRLPSWVPNWAQVRLSNAFLGGYEKPGDRHEICPYQASGSLKSTWQFVDTPEGRTYELRTKGVQLGTVSIIGEDFVGSSTRDMFAEAASIVKSLEMVHIPLSQSREEALLRTCSGDRYPHGALIGDLNHELLERSRGREFIRKRFIVLGGLIGLGPRATKVGDCVFIIPGCHIPIVMRLCRLMLGNNIPCPEHEDISKSKKSDCRTNTKDYILDQWYKVVGGACEYIAYLWFLVAIERRS
jgi:hypothetical protein